MSTVVVPNANSINVRTSVQSTTRVRQSTSAINVTVNQQRTIDVNANGTDSTINTKYLTLKNVSSVVSVDLDGGTF